MRRKTGSLPDSRFACGPLRSPHFRQNETETPPPEAPGRCVSAWSPGGFSDPDGCSQSGSLRMTARSGRRIGARADLHRQLLRRRRQRLFRLLPITKQDKTAAYRTVHKRDIIPIAVIGLAFRLFTIGIVGIQVAFAMKPTIAERNPERRNTGDRPSGRRHFLRSALHMSPDIAVLPPENTG